VDTRERVGGAYEVRIKYWIQTDKVGSKCHDTVEFDDDEWNSMTDEDKEDAIKEIAFGHMDWGFESLD
jgi:hypothetical protein